ncbi:Cysteine-rich receptor-like protein kinase [Anopheles sinensis]|uniref:Cysteine-rich receptor-like protein kinase n=1 Tax=Anopheles sinensis TaxID=74873 RepID=A0A084VY80_ANOSI|nr:Cysteine-rich receptor-like protein kinase [Anopheles sinensis]
MATIFSELQLLRCIMTGKFGCCPKNPVSRCSVASIAPKYSVDSSVGPRIVLRTGVFGYVCLCGS